jgi:hypothetical protein
LDFIDRMHPCNCGFMHVHEKRFGFNCHFEELL